MTRTLLLLSVSIIRGKFRVWKGISGHVRGILGCVRGTLERGKGDFWYVEGVLFGWGMGWGVGKFDFNESVLL